MMVGEVYSLNHPETDVVFYVGSTSSGLATRLSNHLSCVSNVSYEIYQYIRAENITPVIKLLETVKYRNKDKLINCEKKWVNHFMDKGVVLCNTVFNPLKKKPKCVSVRLLKTTQLELKVFSATIGTGMNDVVNMAIIEYLKTNGHEFSNQETIY